MRSYDARWCRLSVRSCVPMHAPRVARQRVVSVCVLLLLKVCRHHQKGRKGRRKAPGAQDSVSDAYYSLGHVASNERSKFEPSSHWSSPQV